MSDSTSPGIEHGAGTGTDVSAAAPFSAGAVRAAYDRVAEDYAKAFGDELAELPLDREMLDLAIAAAGDDGWVLEAGCGPAPAAGYLAECHPGRAARLLGVDLSGAMLTVAGARKPGLARAQGNLLALPLRDRSCSLVIAYYSLQHVPRTAVGAALAEAWRVLRERGLLVTAMHLGDGDVFVEEFLGHRVGTVGGALYGRDELVDLLGVSGFDVEVERQRAPMAHEHDSQRLYLLARRGSPSRDPMAGRAGQR